MSSRRPLTSKAAIGVLGFVGVTAVAGGFEMLAFPDGNVFVKHEWLDDLPVADYRLPGLILGVGLGGGSLVTAFGLMRRPRWSWLRAVERTTGRHWSWAATATMGTALGGWILLEIALIPERSAIEALYGVLAAGLLAVCATRSFRSSLAIAPSP